MQRGARAREMCNITRLVDVYSCVKEGKITQKEACMILGISSFLYKKWTTQLDSAGKPQ